MEHQTSNNSEEIRTDSREPHNNTAFPSSRPAEANYMVPGAIVLAGIIIAGSILYNNTSREVATIVQGEKTQTKSDNVQAVTGEDHILGDPNAPVKLIEFSDLECPFCKRYHETMKRVMEGYGESGKVAWVYRHFPLESLHKKARREAIAAECAAELGGNSAFWAYIDQIFTITPSNDGLDLAELPKIAETVGLNRVAFESCLQSTRHDEQINKQIEDAVNSGGQGTPYTVVLKKDGTTTTINGAQSYEAIKQIIDAAL